MDSLISDLCFGCKLFKEIVWTEGETGRTFCEKCARQQPWTSEEIALMFLMLTIPFKPGDRVECRTAGGTDVELYDGIGIVQEVSTGPWQVTGGTQVYPTFRVKMEEKAEQDPPVPDEMYYTECCLKKVGA